MQDLLKQEKFLLVAIAAAILGYAARDLFLRENKFLSLGASVCLLAAILCASLSVAHHAERLARKVGDPYGTMVLTLSAVLVEVIVLGIVILNTGSFTLARDSIYSAVMLDINGLLGISTLTGGLKHGEQSYNDDSARTYSVMILTAMGISMVVPEFIPHARWQAYSIFTIVAMLLLYGGFLSMQTGQHSYFFNYSYADNDKGNGEGNNKDSGVSNRNNRPGAGKKHAGGDIIRSAAIIIIGIAAVGALAELMSESLNLGLKGTGAPPGLVPLIVAVISAMPEMLTAVRAALADHMQSVVNIAMGASLSSVILTVPAVEGLALYTGRPFDMAMTPVQTVMTLVTLIAVAINLNNGETNAIEGMTHFVLFAAFLMLLCLGL